MKVKLLERPYKTFRIRGSIRSALLLVSAAWWNLFACAGELWEIAWATAILGVGTADLLTLASALLLWLRLLLVADTLFDCDASADVEVPHLSGLLGCLWVFGIACTALAIGSVDVALVRDLCNGLSLGRHLVDWVSCLLSCAGAAWNGDRHLAVAEVERGFSKVAEATGPSAFVGGVILLSDFG